MLAKEIKIKNLKKQREFITARLLEAAEEERDGTPLYKYQGILYEENREHFEKEGICIATFEPDDDEVSLPTHFFFAADVELTPEELQAAEEVEIKPEAKGIRMPQVHEMHIGSLDELPDYIRNIIKQHGCPDGDENAEASSPESAPSTSEE